jgi:hypothetical protein
VPDGSSITSTSRVSWSTSLSRSETEKEIGSSPPTVPVGRPAEIEGGLRGAPHRAEKIVPVGGELEK